MQSAFVTRRSASRTGSLLGDVLGGHAGRPVAVVAVLERTWASSRPLLEALERHPPSAGGVRRRTCSAPPDAPPAEACEGGGITWLMDYTVFAASATGSERAASYKQMLALHHSGGAGKGAPCVLVVPLQVDVLPASIVDEVAYMADAVIDVRQAEEAHLGCQPARPILASVTVRRPGGKSESQVRDDLCAAWRSANSTSWPAPRCARWMQRAARARGWMRGALPRAARGAMRAQGRCRGARSIWTRRLHRSRRAQRSSCPTCGPRRLRAPTAPARPSSPMIMTRTIRMTTWMCDCCAPCDCPHKEPNSCTFVGRSTLGAPLPAASLRREQPAGRAHARRRSGRG